MPKQKAVDRKDRAAARKVDYTPELQLARLDLRLGFGVGAAKERAKLLAKIAKREEPQPVKVKKVLTGDTVAESIVTPKTAAAIKRREKLKASQR